MEAGTANTSSSAPIAKILKLPDRAPRGTPDGEDRDPEGSEFVRAAYEAAGGSCARPVQMRPLARRLGLEPRAVENLAMRLQAERLVRVVSMSNGLLRLTPEGVRAAESPNGHAVESAASDSSESAGSGAPPAGGGDFAGTSAGARVAPVLGRDALRELGGMLGPLKADLDRLDLGGALDGEQRSELAAEIRTIEAQLGSPRPKRRIVAAALESVGGVVGSAAGDAGAETGSETGPGRILRAIDAFLDGAGHTGRAARGTAAAAGEATGKEQAGRSARGARNGAGLARPGGNLADGDGSGLRRPGEGSAAAVGVWETSGVRVRKRARDDGDGRATGQARGAGRPAGDGVNEAVQNVGKGAGSAAEGVGEGTDQVVRGAEGAAGRAGDAAGRATDQEAGAGRRVVRVVDGAGDILRTTLNEHGEILDEDVVGHVADLPSEDEHADAEDRVASRAKDGAGRQAVGEAVGEAGEGRATGEVGQGAGQATQWAGEEAGRAAGEVGQGADRAARGAGAVGQVVEGAGEAAGKAAEGAKRITQDVGGAVGQGTKRGSADEAREADDVAGRTAGQAGGAVQQTTSLVGEVTKGIQDTAGRAVDRAAGTAGGTAPNSQIPGERTPGEERQTVRRTVDEPGHIIIQSTLDESGNVLDEKMVERQRR